VEAIARGIQRLRGVESADVDAKKSVVRITLATGNRVKLEAIRDAIKATGYTPGDAAIEAKGKLAAKKFVVDGSRQVFETDSAEPDGIGTVRGVVPASRPGEPLRLNVQRLHVGTPLAP
jgi:hypothetical protein